MVLQRGVEPIQMMGQLWMNVDIPQLSVNREICSNLAINVLTAILTEEKCLSIQQSWWFPNDCTDKKPFVCQTDPSNINANRNQKSRMEDVDYATIELWLERRLNSKTEMCNSHSWIFHSLEDKNGWQHR